MSLFVVRKMVDATQIIKIVQVKSKDRIALPKEARELLNVKENEHIAFIKDTPGIRVIKVKLDLR